MDDFGDLIVEVYRAATTEMDGRNFAVNLADVFDDRQETIFIDWAHIGEEGNRIVADAIYSHLRPTLIELAAVTPGPEQAP